MATAHVNIGSNLGDSRSLIERAVAGISLLPHVVSVRRSGFIESEPWGYESTHRFLNIGLGLTVSCGAEELFGDLMEIQGNICADSHRNAAGGYADRMIDIDLIYYEGLVLDTPSLTLPHPRMHLRDFVLQPVAELAPAWRHPRLHLTAGEMLAALKDK